jgi:predicted  nucleic acid-binding Zn-ribbon protein
MIKKIFSLLFATLLLVGCESVDSVVDNAEELQASVIEKVAEIKSGIENVVDEAQNAYQALIEKKAELEKMVAEINEAVAAVNKLLGKNETSETETQDLRATITELQTALEAAESTLDEVEATEEILEEEVAQEEPTEIVAE